MNNFKNNKRFGGNRGGNRSGGNSGGRSFNKSSFGGGRNFKHSNRRDSERSFEMYPATCTNCGKSCEVPFRPSGDKPVYCNDCFGRKDGQAVSGNFSHRTVSPMAVQKPQNNDRSFDTLTKQLESVNIKLDKLVSLATSLIAQTESRPISEATTEVPKRKASKKPSAKKK